MKGTNMFIMSSGMRKSVMKGRIERIIRRQRERRGVSAAAALILLLCTLCSFATGETDARPVQLPEDFAGMPDYFACGSGLVLLAEDRVYVQRGEKWEWIYEAENAGCIAGDSSRICIYEEAQGTGEITVIGHDGTAEGSYLLPEGIAVAQMALAGNELILSAKIDGNTLNPNEGEPYALDLTTGEMEHLPMGRVYAIAAEENGPYYLLHDGGELMWDVTRVYPNGTSEVVHSIGSTSAEEIAATADGLYLLSASRLSFVPFSDEKQPADDLLGNFALERPLLARLSCCGERVYIYNYEQELVTVRRTNAGSIIEIVLRSGAEYTRELTFYMHSDIHPFAQYMKRWWADEYPQVQIGECGFDPNLELSLMSGEAGFDILPTYSEVGRKLAPSGAFLNLSEAFPELTEQMRENGFIALDALSHEGDLYGVPNYVALRTVWVRQEMLEELGVEWPLERMSWAELADWGIEQFSGSGYYMLRDEFLQVVWKQHVLGSLQEHGYAQLDTPEFRNSFEALRRLYQAGLIGPYEERSRTIARLGSLSGAEDEYALPTLEGKAADLTDIEAFYVSVDTDDLDLVEAYLTEYIAQGCQTSVKNDQLGALLMEDVSLYAWDPMRYSEPKWRDAVERAHGLREEMLGNIVVNDDYYDDFIEPMGVGAHLDDYLNGRIDIDEYIRIAQAELDLRQYE